MIHLEPLGDRAFLARFPDELQAAAWAEAVRARHWDGIEDVVVAYRTAAVHLRAEGIDVERLERDLARVKFEPGRAGSGRRICLPVLYDGEDLAEVARACRIREADVIALHSGRDYHVYAIGFQPGFPYAGYLPEGLGRLARRAEPRVRVPEGSVAIAGRQTGIYPAATPGGWQLLGRTPLRIVDLERGHFPIRAGDRIRFHPIDAQEFADRRGEIL